ncbi:putative protein rna12 [Phaeomoniella chlamydospora]|uniref:Mitochondrial escape protein 2 n=1 Tax=Phaeomoniella chlamydospora TaxID=158046 RepID=A0A0G2FTI4_PHACM|nr:putative protein rna12 [Phaeomoniella chlamydospora]
MNRAFSSLWKGATPLRPKEGIFFVNNVFPLKLQWLIKIPFINPEKDLQNLMNKFHKPSIAAADPVSIIRRALPEKLPIQVTEVIPRFREGGAYVKFTHDETITLKEIEATLTEYLDDQPVKPWFNPFEKVRAALVRGKPWVEDLYRFPSARLKVEFLPTTPETSAAELTQETLFSLFRRYGKLAEITPQPADSKILPKYTTIDFTRIRYAIMAKACMHGFILVEEAGGGKAGTVLKLSFERKAKPHWIRDWIMNHPRFVIPAVAAFLAAFTVAVFDPIRTFFIKMHITHGFHLSGNKLWQWARRQASSVGDVFTFRKKQESSSMQTIWEDRKSDIEQLKTWMIETADTFIVVQGPRGSGKRELVLEQALKDRKNILVIDSKPIQEARGDTATIAATANQVGYRPIFSWMNSISSLIDLAAQGTIGTKTGFSETLEAQIVKILGNTTMALKQIGLEGRKKDDKDADLGDDEYLEAHPEKRPVVVIDNFLHKSNENSAIYDRLGEWAAGLTTGNIAHIIFLTTDVSFSKSLGKSLPDRVFRQISLGDASPEVAKKFVIKHLDADAEVEEGKKKLAPSQVRDDLGELDSCIEALGGRLTDLEFLARRIKTGESPQNAVQQIIEQSASEILKMYLLEVDISSRNWSPEQAWLLVKQLSQSDRIRYNELLLSDIYKKNGESTLQALEQAELITIVSSNGRPYAIKPGKPVFQAAFRYLTSDAVLKSRLELALLAKLVGIENKNMEKYEMELRGLAELPGQPRELIPRIKYLLGKCSTSQGKIEGWEREMGELKKVLGKEF